jgi:hypothetical protein
VPTSGVAQEPALAGGGILVGILRHLSDN